LGLWPAAESWDDPDMSNISDGIRRFAEEPDGSLPEAPLPARRIITPAFILLLSPSPAQSAVTTVRTTEAELDGVIAEARALARQAGYRRTVWFAGPSCRPAGLAGLLAQRGFTPATLAPFEPEFTVMALAHPPPPPPPGVEARLIRTADEYVRGLAIALEAFNEPAEVAAEWLAAAPAMWKRVDGVTSFAHIAVIDGCEVGYAFTAAGSDGLFLGGSGVLADARGRGAYRALLAARWARAALLGKPALAIHAGAMSRPILERCGFERLCTLALLDDPVRADGSG
jgi:GNAT superfamily N-acetyltransferase